MKNLTSLGEWLGWLETCHPSEIDLGLARITLVAEKMNLLKPRGKVITIGGTNGKGSCVTAISALLHRANWSVGVYTSPHIHHYNERIIVNGQPASDQDIVAAFTAIYSACQSLSPAISLTYFEYATLASLHVFSAYDVDVLILEVGLGGRLDAVNMLDADIAVVTSIDIDHKDWLGDTRELIAVEKAGIFRANRPAICGDSNPPVTLIEYASSISANLMRVGEAFSYVVQEQGETWSWSNTRYTFESQPIPQLPLPSMASALQVISELNVNINTATFECLAELRVPGRFQYLSVNSRHVILDVAHNPAATAFMVKKLKVWKGKNPSARVVAIVAMMSDKDRLASLSNVLEEVDVWLAATLDGIPRAASGEVLSQDLASLGQVVTKTDNIKSCLDYAFTHTATTDLILVFGSFFTVAESLRTLNYKF